MSELVTGWQKNFPHVQQVQRKAADGTLVVSRYHRKTRIRLLHEPGTPEFEIEYKRACEPLHRPSARNHPRLGYVYFIEAATLKLIKIGCATKPHSRLSMLQVGSPDQLRLIGVIASGDVELLEQHIHHMHKEARVRGEWFRPVPALIEYINAYAYASDWRFGEPGQPLGNNPETCYNPECVTGL